MPRSLRVRPDSIPIVKQAVKRNGFPSQKILAENVQLARSTVNNFLTGKPVDYSTFEELCHILALEWRDISYVSDSDTDSPKLLSTSPDKVSYPSGSISLDSPFYLERFPLEEQVNREISKPGALIRIKAPREMGKTSLLLRILDYAKRIGYQAVSLNLEQTDQAILSDLNHFLRWLCANIAYQLNLASKLDNYWDEDLGSKISCSLYLQDYVLEQLDTPLVLALDEMNQVFEHPLVAKDFLPLLRSWYEESKTLAVWQKLRLIVVHSTEIYVPLQLNQSPFNVGLPIQLTYFSKQEVEELAQRYGLEWKDEPQAEQLMEMIGGHPALVHIAIYHLSHLSGAQITLEEVLETAPTSTGIYEYHLQRHLVTLQNQPELGLALDKLINATEPIKLDLIPAYKLTRMGLIKNSGDKFTLSCKLYRQYFQNQSKNLNK